MADLTITAWTRLEADRFALAEWPAHDAALGIVWTALGATGS
jgi:hypothetical protein